VLLSTLVAFPALASVSDAALRTAQVDGTVWAVARVGDRTIIGGDFSAVGGLARMNAAAILPDGSVDPTFDPRPNGIVYGVAGSEDGSRVFLGGDFTQVGTTPRTDLAALDSTGSVVQDWRADSNGLVHALEVKGSRLYAGGTFTEIGGVLRRRLAAVDVATAAVNLTFHPWPDWTVRDIAVSPDGTKVYATGGFAAIGGQPRRGAAEILASDGRATAFDPSDGGVGIAAAVSPDGRRFLYSTTNNRLWAYDPASGSNSPVWVVQTSGDTQAIASSATEVYFGGHFRQLSDFGLKRGLLASVRVADGQPTAWAPQLSTDSKGMGPWAIAVTPDAVIVGGDFTKVNRAEQSGLAFFTGQP
jgi:hypothetical protein